MKLLFIKSELSEEKPSDNNNVVFTHRAAGERGYRGKKWEISSYSHSNPLKRALLPLTAKHFDTSLLKITVKKNKKTKKKNRKRWNRMILRGFGEREWFAVFPHLFSACKKNEIIYFRGNETCQGKKRNRSEQLLMAVFEILKFHHSWCSVCWKAFWTVLHFYS